MLSPDEKAEVHWTILPGAGVAELCSLGGQGPSQSWVSSAGYTSSSLFIRPLLRHLYSHPSPMDLLASRDRHPLCWKGDRGHCHQVP